MFTSHTYGYVQTSTTAYMCEVHETNCACMLYMQYFAAFSLSFLLECGKGAKLAQNCRKMVSYLPTLTVR